MRLLLLLSAVAMGCGPSKWMRGGEGVASLAVRNVEWNAARVPVGRIAALAESREELALFGDEGATVFVAGTRVARIDGLRSWKGASAIPAEVGTGTWLVGIAADGRLFRIRERKSLEPISGRYGLVSVAVDDVVDLGSNRVLFTWGTGCALAEGGVVTRFHLPFRAAAGGSGRAVGLVGDVVRAFAPGDPEHATFTVPGAAFVAVDDRGRLFVANDRAIWAEDDAGRLVLRYEATAGPIHGLVASAERVWFAEGSELGVVERTRVAATTGASMPTTARLVGSKSGGVWALANGELQHLTTAPAAAWEQSIAKIHARVCASCHGPGGTAGVDLSTASRWEAKRDAIRKRVVEERTMPPPGHPLTDEERAAIAAWAK